MGNSFFNTEYVKPMGVTSEANILSINFSNAMNTYIGRSIILSSQFEAQKFKQFIELRDKWKEETLFVSSGTLLISNSAYKSIIQMGSLTIPWIFREMKRNDDHWFFALEKITGINPIKPENVGIIEKMKEDWFDWASQNDYA